MKKLKFLGILLFVILFIPKLSFALDEDISYIIGKGDTLEISVWGFTELSRTVSVRPDGKISFPLIDEEIKVEGMTSQQLDKQITLKLSKEVKEPKVTIIVTGFGSKKIWVLGEAVTPGVYPFAGSLTTLEAITQAGGYRNSARLENIVVIRNGKAPKPEAFVVNLAKVIEKRDTALDMKLQPGDVVYLPRSAIARLDSFIKFFTDKISPSIYYGIRDGY